MKAFLVPSFFLFGVIILFGVQKVSAQETISGRLVDEVEQPVPYANVVLLSLPDSIYIQGTITGEAGDFSFEQVDLRNKVLQISYVGYKTLNKACMSGEVGVLRLVPQTIILNETVIVGQRPTFTVKGNSLVTNVQNTLLSNIGTGNDVLKRIPGIRIDQNKAIEVFGKGAPLIYINGRLVRDNSELEQINSKDIAKIELITNPGAEYDAEVKAVLKIKTVKPVGEGLGGFVRASGDYASGMGHMEMANLNYRKGGLDVFGQVLHMGAYVEQEEEIELQMRGKQLWDIRNQAAIETDGYRFLSVQSGINYYFSDRHSVGANYQLLRSPYNGSVNTSQDFDVKKDNQDFDKMKTDLLMAKRLTTNKVNMYYNGIIADKLSVDINVDVLSGKSNNRQKAEETSVSQESRVVNSLGEADYTLYAGKAVFSYPIWKGSLTFGGEANQTNHNDSYFNEEEIVPSSQSETREDKVAAFASYHLGLEHDWSLNVGLRYEHTRFNYYINGEKQADQSRTYDNVYPSFSFSFPKSEFRNSISYTVKTLRPRYEQLDGNVQYSNRYMYKQGNPLLKPETQHDVTFMTGYKFVNFSVSYQYIKNYIANDRLLYNDEGSISISRDLNYDKNQRLNVMLSASPKVAWWQPALSIYATQQFFEAPYRDGTMKYNNPVAYITFNNDFSLPKGYILSLTGDYHTAGSSGNVQIFSSGSLDVGLRKNFLNDRLIVNLKGSDLLHTYRAGGIRYSPSCVHLYKDTYNSRKIELSVMFRFNASASKYKGGGAANEEMNRL